MRLLQLPLFLIGVCLLLFASASDPMDMSWDSQLAISAMGMSLIWIGVL